MWKIKFLTTKRKVSPWKKLYFICYGNKGASFLVWYRLLHHQWKITGFYFQHISTMHTMLDIQAYVHRTFLPYGLLCKVRGTLVCKVDRLLSLILTLLKNFELNWIDSWSKYMKLLMNFSGNKQKCFIFFQLLTHVYMHHPICYMQNTYLKSEMNLQLQFAY